VIKSLFFLIVAVACATARAESGPATESTEAKPVTANEIEQQMADEERASSIDAANRQVKSLQAAMKEAQKAKDLPRIKSLRSQIEDAKKEVGQLRKLSDEYFLVQARRKLKAAAAKAEEEQAVKKSGPVVIQKMGINYNVIGLPELSLVVLNSESVAVEAYEITAECFNKFDEPVSFPGQTNVFLGSSQKRLDANSTQMASWQLSLQRATAKANVWVSRVKMADGRVITFTKEEAKKKPYGLAKARLME